MTPIESMLRSPWLAVSGLVVGAFVVSRVVVALVRPLLRRAARRSAWTWDDQLIEAIATPVSLLLALQAVRASLPWFSLDPRGVELVGGLTTVGTSALVMWVAFRIIDVAVAVVGSRPWAMERPASRSLLAITGRVSKVILMALAGIVVLAQLGVSVASLIAGLGIGGLALALAAQKTVENLFGTMSIAVDQPLREGDFVRVGDHLGTIEAIGLRSTRIRTLDRTIVTVPNGDLADQRIESYTARDRIRLACSLGLTYGTTAAQVRQVVEELEATLREHPMIWHESIVVRFRGFGASSLDLDVMAWFQVTDWNEFQAIRQDVMLRFMEIVETRTAGFAFPTQTLHVAPITPSDAARRGRQPGSSEDARGVDPIVSA